MTKKALKDIFVLDTETTGPDVFKHELLSIYITPLNRGRSLSLYIRLKDTSETSWGNIGSRYFKNYEDEWRRKAVYPETAMRRLNKYLESFPSKNITLAGHNVAFDYYFIKKLSHVTCINLTSKVSHRLLDVHSLLFHKYVSDKIPKSALSSHGSLQYYLEKSERPGPKQRHIAKTDVEVTRLLLQKLIDAP